MPVTNYFWDMESDNVLLEKDETGVTTAVYTNEPELYGKLISQHRDGETYFHHYDGGEDTRVVTDEDENVVETATYSGFGEVVTKTSSIVNPFGYKGALGYYTNSETSDFYVRARIYLPKIGRWLSVDPLSIRRFHPYSYVDNRPTVFVDPEGLFPTQSLTIRPAGEGQANVGGFPLPKPTCYKCGGHDVTWIMEAGERLLILQYIEHHLVWEEADCGCCEAVDIHSCKWSIVEYLAILDPNASGDNPNTGVRQVMDSWRADPITDVCTKHGKLITTSQVRGFRDVDGLKLGGSRGVPWQPPGLECPDEIEPRRHIGVGKHLRSLPAWWHEAAYEGSTMLVSEWDCCPDTNQTMSIKSAWPLGSEDIPCRFPFEPP